MMKHIYTRLLNDDELRPHLERGDSVVFTGTTKAWQEIERQVERLGFGEVYVVSHTRKTKTAGAQAATRVSPLRPPQKG